MKSVFSWACVLLLSAIGLTTLALAQSTTTGEIYGGVIDKDSRQALPDAAVTLVVMRMPLTETAVPRPWRFAPRDLPGYQRASLVISATISSVLQGREK